MIKWIVNHFLKVKKSTEFSFVTLWKLSRQPRTFCILYPMASLASIWMK